MYPEINSIILHLFSYGCLTKCYLCTAHSIMFPDTEAHNFGDSQVCVHLLSYSFCTVKTDEGSTRSATVLYCQD
jgi:hypothetical protein